MTIRIKGTIGNTPVDLTIDGLTAETMASMLAPAAIDTPADASAASESTAREPQVPSKPTARPSVLLGSQAKARALEAIRQEGELSACDLINILAESGADDRTIKRTLMLLREDPTICTAPSSDGLQKVYRSA